MAPGNHPQSKPPIQTPKGKVDESGQTQKSHELALQAFTKVEGGDSGCALVGS